LGKSIIKGATIEKCDFWPFEEEKQYEVFVIGVDDDDESIAYTSNPDELADYFGKNRHAPHYLTSVFFRREVLAKYYNEPQKYSVDDGLLWCGGKWTLRMDNSHLNYVVVFLGDLGRDLPHKEQLHWKRYNVPPEGQMSEARFRRDFLAQWASSDDPIGDVRSLRQQINSVAQSYLGGPIWRELEEPDRTEFERLHSVATEPALKLAILSLCKAFIEAIDQGVLAGFTGSTESEDRTLALMEALCETLEGDRTIVEPLRALQRLRSKGGIAHMVSSQRASALRRLGIDNMDPAPAFQTILRRLLGFLRELNRLLAQAFA